MLRPLNRQAVIDESFSTLGEPGVQLRRYINFLTSGSRGWGDYYADQGERFLRIGNLPRTNLEIRGDIQFVDLPADVTEGSRTRLQEGDLLFSITAYLGSVAVVGGDWVGAYVSQHVALCRLDRDRVDPRFIGWFMLSTAGQDQLNEGAAGGTKMQLALDDIRGLRVPTAPIEEQRRIAAYLDRETAGIDRLIEEQQRLIEMLRERRGSAISTAVARGLDETVALKDSGLPGAGPVPVHWVVTPLRYTVSFQEGPGIMAADFRDEGVPLLRVSCVRAARSTLEGCNYLDPDEVDRRWSQFRVDPGDLLISASASMGTVSEVTEETAGAVPYTGIIRIKPGRMHKDFVRWFVVSGEFIDQVDSLKTGSTIQHFGPTHLAQMRVALPPTDEQHQIATYLDEQAAKIDTLIAETERFIELVHERRAALISAAVTGQIDVRDMA